MKREMAADDQTGDAGKDVMKREMAADDQTEWRSCANGIPEVIITAGEEEEEVVAGLMRSHRLRRSRSSRISCLSQASTAASASRAVYAP